MKSLRFFAIVICIFVSTSLLGCGDIDLGKIGLPFGEVPVPGAPAIETTAPEYSTEVYTAYTVEETVVETTEETRQVVWQTQEVAETTASYEWFGPEEVR